MTKKELTLAAISHQQIDCIPWNIELTHGFAKRLQAETGCDDPEAFLGNHMLRVKYKKNKQLSQPGASVDLFGVHWADAADGGDVGVVTHFPLLAYEDDFGDYTFPAVDESLAAWVCDKLGAEDDRFTMFSLTMGFFERAWSLKSMQELLISMASEPVYTQRLFECILVHHMALLDLVLERPFDALYFGDDWGSQRGLIMGPTHWRNYIKSGVAEIFAKAKNAGKLIVLHSCGDLREIIPDLIEIGVDVYNTVQPEIYDLARLKQEYGHDLTFYGGISTQQFLPWATADQVFAKTLDVLEIMGGNGGYILSPTHAVTPDIPPENVMAMIDAGCVFAGLPKRFG